MKTSERARMSGRKCRRRDELRCSAQVSCDGQRHRRWAWFTPLSARGSRLAYMQLFVSQRQRRNPDGNGPEQGGLRVDSYSRARYMRRGRYASDRGRQGCTLGDRSGRFLEHVVGDRALEDQFRTKVRPRSRFHSPNIAHDGNFGFKPQDRVRGAKSLAQSAENPASPAWPVEFGSRSQGRISSVLPAVLRVSLARRTSRRAVRVSRSASGWPDNSRRQHPCEASVFDAINGLLQSKSVAAESAAGS